MLANVGGSLGVSWYLWAATARELETRPPNFNKCGNTYADMQKCTVVVLDSLHAIDSAASPLSVSLALFAVALSAFSQGQPLLDADVVSFLPACSRLGKVAIRLGGAIDIQIRRVFEIIMKQPRLKWRLTDVAPLAVRLCGREIHPLEIERRCLSFCNRCTGALSSTVLEVVGALYKR